MRTHARTPGCRIPFPFAFRFDVSSLTHHIDRRADVVQVVQPRDGLPADDQEDRVGELDVPDPNMRMDGWQW
jgi:hypothetical protein